MNIVTATVTIAARECVPLVGDGDEARRRPARMVSYQTDYDLTIFLRNVAVAGALCAAHEQGAASDDVYEGGRWVEAWQPGCGKEMPR